MTTISRVKTHTRKGQARGGLEKYLVKSRHPSPKRSQGPAMLQAAGPINGRTRRLLERGEPYFVRDKTGGPPISRRP
jgi:hypothetical protein